MLVHGIIPPRVQDFAFAFVEIREIAVSPLLQPAKIFLNGSTSIWCISCFSQFCVIYKFSEGVLSPVIQVINVDVKTALALLSICGVHY